MTHVAYHLDNQQKQQCICGYLTEHRCFIHPGRPAHIMSKIWLCHECDRSLQGDYSDYRIARLVEQRWVLCPNCAWDEAVQEYEQRELERFLDTKIVDEDPVI